MTVLTRETSTPDSIGRRGDVGVTGYVRKTHGDPDHVVVFPTSPIHEEY
jgi:hypothetical protein